MSLLHTISRETMYDAEPRPTSREGAFIILGERPFALGRSSSMWLAAAPEGDSGPRLAVAREASQLALSDGEPYADFVRSVQARAFLAPGTPRLLGALGADGTEIDERRFAFNVAAGGAPPPVARRILGGGAKVVLTIEEDAGDIAFRELVEAAVAQSGQVPIGVALHLAARIASMLAHADRARVSVQFEPGDVHVNWDGSVRVLVKPFPRWEERLGGAMAGTIIAQIDWMPPERILGYRTSSRGEMYTLGVILFEALAGKHPLHQRGMTTMQQVRATIENDVPNIRSARPDVPDDVARIVERCTRRTETERFPTWQELAAALAEAHDRLEPVDESAFAGTLAHLFPGRRSAALAFAEQVRMLDLDELYERLPTKGFEPVAVPSLPVSEAATSTNDWDDGTNPDIDVAAWGVDARPMLRVGSGALLIDVKTVTNAEYARFVASAERTPPPHWNGARTPPLSLFDKPVTHVSYDDALSYARWARKRIPKAEEWWIAFEQLGAQRLGHDGTSPWEWTSSAYANGDEVLGHVVRGGAWRNRPGAQADVSNASFESEGAADVTFRCVADAPQE